MKNHRKVRYRTFQLRDGRKSARARLDRRLAAPEAESATDDPAHPPRGSHAVLHLVVLRDVHEVVPLLEDAVEQVVRVLVSAHATRQEPMLVLTQVI